MLLAAGKVALVILLFLLLFVAFRQAGMVLARKASARKRYGRLNRPRPEPVKRRTGIGRHLERLLEVTQWIRSLSAFLVISAVFGLSGLAAGVFLFQSVKGVLVLTPLFSSLPYLLLRLRLLSKQFKTRLEFLPAVEVFYQQYLMQEGGNIRTVLAASIAEGRIQYPVKPAFERLSRNLAAGRDLDEALAVFQMELGHVWADYFANMFRIGMVEGVDISRSLKDLIGDMRRAQLFDQKARNRLLEIRIASFSPAGFLLLFVGINMRLNPHNSYRYYYLDPEGRSLLLNAIVLVFLSLLMGIYLSMRRM